MDSHNVPTTTCALKVKIKCCTACPEKVIKKLQKMNGVDSVSYDAEKWMLRVSGSGNIDPMLLIKKFAEWGKKAELYSFQKGQVSGSSSKEKIQDKELDDDSSGSDDHDHGENFDVHAPKKDDDRYISWQHPCLVKNSPPKEATPVIKPSTKKKRKGFFGWLFGKKEEEARKIGENVMTKSVDTTKWHFPRTSMSGYRAPGPYHGERPHYMNQNQTMMFPGLVRPPQGYGYGYESMLPRPPPLPYGSFQSRLPPRMNPMIHYTDYNDNYYNYS